MRKLWSRYAFCTCNLWPPALTWPLSFHLFCMFIHKGAQFCEINLIIESGVWKIRHRHKSMAYRRTDRWTDRYTTHTCIYLIIVAVSKKSVQSFHYHLCSFITIYIHVSYQSSKTKVAHVMPRLTCYKHACVHVVLIILIWINRNRLVLAIN